MPLRPLLSDLREHPLGERPMRLLSYLDRMAAGDALIVVNDRDLDPLLHELRQVLENRFAYWIPEAGPEVWRILISCEDPFDKEPEA